MINQDKQDYVQASSQNFDTIVASDSINEETL